MGVMVDAVDPANIPASYDGAPALRITVLASALGQAFDFETGNAGPVPVARAMRARVDRGQWAVGYVNEGNVTALTDAMSANGLAWSDAARFPAPGVYAWCADPSGNIAAGRWRPPAVPVAVQTRYLGATDESVTAANFGARVAGYIDGAGSTWPAAAWDRFTAFNPGNPGAPANPGASIRGKEEESVIIKQANGAAWLLQGDHAIGIEDGPDQQALVAAGVGVAVVSDEFAAKVRGALVTVN